MIFYIMIYQKNYSDFGCSEKYFVNILNYINKLNLKVMTVSLKLLNY